MIPGELVLIAPVFNLERELRFESIGIYLKVWKGGHPFHYGTLCDVILPHQGICAIELDRIFPLRELPEHLIHSSFK